MYDAKYLRLIVEDYEDKIEEIEEQTEEYKQKIERLLNELEVATQAIRIHKSRRGAEYIEEHIEPKIQQELEETRQELQKYIESTTVELEALNLMKYIADDQANIISG